MRIAAASGKSRAFSACAASSAKSARPCGESVPSGGIGQQQAAAENHVGQGHRLVLEIPRKRQGMAARLGGSCSNAKGLVPEHFRDAADKAGRRKSWIVHAGAVSFDVSGRAVLDLTLRA
jgi:hypothetical protein